MKLSVITATLAELKTTIAGFLADKATATATALADFQSKLTAVETGAVAQLTQIAADLEKANASIQTLSTEKSVIIAALDAASVAVKIEGGDATKIAALAPTAKITALQTNVADTLAKLQVDPAKIPNPAPASTATSASNNQSVKSRTEFLAMTPVAQLAFVNAGGKVTDPK